MTRPDRFKQHRHSQQLSVHPHWLKRPPSQPGARRSQTSGSPSVPLPPRGVGRFGKGGNADRNKDFPPLSANCAKIRASAATVSNRRGNSWFGFRVGSPVPALDAPQVELAAGGSSGFLSLGFYRGDEPASRYGMRKESRSFLRSEMIGKTARSTARFHGIDRKRAGQYPDESPTPQGGVASSAESDFPFDAAPRP